MRSGAFVFTTIFLLANSEVAAQPAASGYALVVGINRYTGPQLPPLKNAVKDATAVSGFLRDQGMNVTTLFDAEATKRKILYHLEDVLARRLRDGDRVLIYFSGHGTTERFGDEDHGYIVPADADGSASANISMEELQSLSKKMGAARHQLFIMDACYGGMLALKSTLISPDRPNYISELMRRKGRRMITAGGKNQRVSDGGSSGHSLFTGQFLRGLREGLADLDGNGYVTTSELAVYLQSAASSNLQTPQTGDLYGDEGGEFIFSVEKKDILVSPNMDSDRDGVPDLRDVCKDRPETLNDYEDEDGCPDEKRMDAVRGPRASTADFTGSPDAEACGAGDGNACSNAASSAYTAEEKEKARQYARHGCETLSHANTCAWLTKLEYEIGNKDRAFEIATTYCSIGTNATTCSWAAQIAYESGNKNATRMYAGNACRAGDADGCTWQVRLDYEAGDLTAALTRAVTQCESAHLLSCEWAANMYYDKRNFATGLPYAEKACEGMSANGCDWAARLHFDLHNYKRAIEVGARSCDTLSSGTGCAIAANAYLDRGNRVAAFKYAMKGCELKNPDACAVEKTMKKSGAPKP
jgi:hypothetical protein